jgi:hypothetical protein
MNPHLTEFSYEGFSDLPFTEWLDPETTKGIPTDAEGAESESEL